MKNTITFLICILSVITGFAQSEAFGSSLTIPDRTPELEALYLQAQTLENNGTAAQINANRLAIKNAWQEVNPEIANLYKPIDAPMHGPEIIEVEISAQDSEPIERSPEDWDTDLQLREGFIDGLDMDVTGDGDIYIAAFENYIGDDAALYVYRSTDDGTTFELWKQIGILDTYFSKIQVISVNGNGDDYLHVYSLSNNGFFSDYRWNMATGDFDIDQITANVTDFSVDRNYPLDTSAQRVFAIYTRDNSGNPKIYSARSTAGSYGFDWVDEVDLPGANLGDIAFAYGLNGACYTTYKGLGSGNLYARPNPDYNDPGSWGGTAETVEDGGVKEIKNPTIRAARLDLSSDKVIIWASSRPAGSSNSYDGVGYLRVNGGNFATFVDYPSGGGDDWSLLQTDSWVRRVNDTEEIRTSYVRERVDGTENNTNRSLTFNGNGFDDFEPVADADKDVFQGFPTAIAETSDNLPCAAFAGSSTAVTAGYNLYFDRKSTLGVEENNLEGFTFYPNPTSSILNLSAKNTIEKIAIYSLLGQKVMQVTPQQKEQSINISPLRTGIYVMKVEVNDEIGTYKIIKE